MTGIDKDRTHKQNNTTVTDNYNDNYTTKLQ